jgi:hypothetical protein
VIEVLGFDADARIGDRDHMTRAWCGFRVRVDVLLRERRRAERDRQPAALRHRVSRIDREIDERLLDASRIDTHRRGFRERLRDEFDVLSQSAAGASARSSQ